jgi:hypothetical protein
MAALALDCDCNVDDVVDNVDNGYDSDATVYSDDEEIPDALLDFADLVDPVFFNGFEDVLSTDQMLKWIYALGFQGEGRRAERFCQAMLESEPHHAQLFLDSYLTHLSDFQNQFLGLAPLTHDPDLITLAVSPATVAETLGFLLKQDVPQPLALQPHLFLPFGSAQHFQLLNQLPFEPSAALHVLSLSGCEKSPVEESQDVDALQRWRLFAQF